MLFCRLNQIDHIFLKRSRENLPEKVREKEIVLHAELGDHIDHSANDDSDLFPEDFGEQVWLT